MLKRPITIGDTIITKSDGQCAIREQFTVVKLYKEHVGVGLSGRHLAGVTITQKHLTPEPLNVSLPNAS